ncbi:MAG TPA: carboxymuconolactone decarboxylase family protein [Candidatus Binatia bacterium]|nr:carboxymuconolactone decarboxylase family protein [Candidatus Binatia bacterium]
MKHGRLPWFAPQALSDEQRGLYEQIVGGPRGQGPRPFPLADEEGRLHGPFNALLTSPEVGAAVQELGAAIRYRSSLPARAREIAILELAVRRRCAFEWFAHERVGRAAGLGDEEIAALRSGEGCATLDRTEALVRRLVRTMLANRDVDDALYAQAETTLGVRMLMDLVALVGYYDLLALSLQLWRTPLPDGARSPFE